MLLCFTPPLCAITTLENSPDRYDPPQWSRSVCAFSSKGLNIQDYTTSFSQYHQKCHIIRGKKNSNIHPIETTSYYAHIYMCNLLYSITSQLPYSKHGLSSFSRSAQVSYPLPGVPSGTTSLPLAPPQHTFPRNDIFRRLYRTFWHYSSYMTSLPLAPSQHTLPRNDVFRRHYRTFWYYSSYMQQITISIAFCYTITSKCFKIYCRGHNSLYIHLILHLS